MAAWQRYRKKKGGSLKFMLAAEVPALQAADMLVHELYDDPSLMVLDWKTPAYMLGTTVSMTH